MVHHRRNQPSRPDNPFSRGGARLTYSQDARYGPQKMQYQQKRFTCQLATCCCCIGVFILYSLVSWIAAPPSPTSRLTDLTIKPKSVEQTIKPAAAAETSHANLGYKSHLQDGQEERIPYHRASPDEDEDQRHLPYHKAEDEDRSKQSDDTEEEENRHRTEELGGKSSGSNRVDKSSSASEKDAAAEASTKAANEDGKKSMRDDPNPDLHDTKEEDSDDASDDKSGGDATTKAVPNEPEETDHEGNYELPADAKDDSLSSGREVQHDGEVIHDEGEAGNDAESDESGKKVSKAGEGSQGVTKPSEDEGGKSLQNEGKLSERGGEPSEVGQVEVEDNHLPPPLPDDEETPMEGEMSKTKVSTPLDDESGARDAEESKAEADEHTQRVHQSDDEDAVAEKKKSTVPDDATTSASQHLLVPLSDKDISVTADDNSPLVDVTVMKKESNDEDNESKASDEEEPPKLPDEDGDEKTTGNEDAELPKMFSEDGKGNSKDGKADDKNSQDDEQPPRLPDEEDEENDKSPETVESSQKVVRKDKTEHRSGSDDSGTLSKFSTVAKATIEGKTIELSREDGNTIVLTDNDEDGEVKKVAAGKVQRDSFLEAGVTENMNLKVSDVLPKVSSDGGALAIDDATAINESETSEVDEPAKLSRKGESRKSEEEPIAVETDSNSDSKSTSKKHEVSEPSQLSDNADPYSGDQKVESEKGDNADSEGFAKKSEMTEHSTLQDETKSEDQQVAVENEESADSESTSRKSQVSEASNRQDDAHSEDQPVEVENEDNADSEGVPKKAEMAKPSDLQSENDPAISEDQPISVEKGDKTDLNGLSTKEAESSNEFDAAKREDQPVGGGNGNNSADSDGALNKSEVAESSKLTDEVDAAKGEDQPIVVEHEDSNDSEGASKKSYVIDSSSLPQEADPAKNEDHSVPVKKGDSADSEDFSKKSDDPSRLSQEGDPVDSKEKNRRSSDLADDQSGNIVHELISSYIPEAQNPKVINDKKETEQLKADSVTKLRPDGDEETKRGDEAAAVTGKESSKSGEAPKLPDEGSPLKPAGPPNDEQAAPDEVVAKTQNTEAISRDLGGESKSENIDARDRLEVDENPESSEGGEESKTEVAREMEVPPQDSPDSGKTDSGSGTNQLGDEIPSKDNDVKEDEETRQYEKDDEETQKHDTSPKDAEADNEDEGMVGETADNKDKFVANDVEILDVELGDDIHAGGATGNLRGRAFADKS